ncbi:MAG: PDZ domain-containing protein [Muribaculaceae bacterium]|nr:PDZ domain-containing protein [Muribaculaceae bacterium]MEE1297831.1 S41 family peptidase [Muribaculaceae bacterium]
MKSNKNNLVLLPIAIAVSIVIGITIGGKFSNSGGIHFSDRKINTILNLVSDGYVDTVNINNIVEQTIPQLLSNLDPHTVYIPSKDLNAVNEELDGSFSGIGVSFFLMNDTVRIIEVLSGGPSEKAGLIAGDKIVSINDSAFVGPSINNQAVFNKLRGIKGSKVKLGIKRNNTNDILSYDITRGDIPMVSIDASYMVDKEIGYIRIDKFARTTYDEFLQALVKLKNEGAEKYILDLRGNGGGFMEMAILMANEFLPENSLIVYTKGRERKNDQQFWSDGNGSFQNVELAILIDEFSASASEILAGAIQDNDRGLIVGRRSFGKGLVQKQFQLNDSSAVRMTVSRYYTPSGRCIQKDYKKGEEAYNQDIYDRYAHGELSNKDSIRIDTSNVFMTVNHRKVYGGGGIVPDIFVPTDTSGITSYYINVSNAGLLQKFAYEFAEINRDEFKELNDYKQFLRILPSNNSLLYDFVTYASKNGVPARWFYINQSKSLIVNQLKALIARDIFGTEAFYPIYNKNDKMIQKAVKAFNENKASIPISENISN